ncbi:class I SAM-dependent methyltransferase [Faunimonas sp. B44]|uniref:class I SAM-dependent methyltransferase n=1 Tax=Faunimonas sp. B44 TaxID=3461493 RepID=UPI0040440320
MRIDAMQSSQWFYKLAYWTGLKPWEWAAAQEAERISALFDREQSGRQRPYGRALDVGCGTGIQAVELARRGWDVTGIELERKALREARRRADLAGVQVRFLHADVTEIGKAGMGDGFSFVLDIGVFHGFGDEQRTRMGKAVTSATLPGASMLMLAWAPARRPSFLPRGADSPSILAAFPGWMITDQDDLPGAALPIPMRNARPSFYRLKRSE